MKWNKEERIAYGKIFRLALPIIIQNLFSSAISSADVIMLNSVGQSAISAASLAVQYSGILYMVYYGLGTGATMLRNHHFLFIAHLQFFGIEEVSAAMIIAVTI